MRRDVRRRYGGGFAVAAIVFSIVGASAQNPAAPVTTTTRPALSSAGPAPTAVSSAAGLADLASMTFSCPQAALNAAAREAAKAPTQGTYQFAYFNIVNDAHHATYEVHFRSNVQSEPSLRYCVALYCQQGWDPRTSKTEVMLMTAQAKSTRQPAHAASCGMTPAEERRRRGVRR